MNEFPIEAPPADEEQVLEEQDSELEEQDVDSQDSDAAETEDEDEGEDEDEDESEDGELSPREQWLLERAQQATLQAVQPVLTEEGRRIRQSLRSVSATINAQLTQAKAIYDGLVATGKLDANDARQQLREYKDTLEQERYAQEERVLAQEAAYAQIEQNGQVNPQTEQLRQQVTATFAQIFRQSGLSPDDPETELLPRTLSGDPNLAIEQYKQSINNALYVKRQRVAQQQPKNKPPTMDMGNGGSAPRGTNPLAGITDPDELWKLAKRGGRIR